MPKDWITEMNDIIDTLYPDEDTGNRYLVEVLITFIESKKLGKELLKVLKTENDIK